MKLQELIEKHKATAEAFETASERLEQVQNAYAAAQEGNRITVQIGSINASADEGAEFLNSVADDICEKITRHMNIIDALSPTFAAQFQEGVAKIRAELTKKIDAAIAEEEARQEEFGLAEVNRNWENLNEAESETLLAVCRYRCETIAEERVKIRYVLEASSFRGCADINEECSKALLQSAADPIAA